MSQESASSYDDGRIRCDADGLTIGRYYGWVDKRIGYAAIRGVEKLPLTGNNKIRRWRIWGSGDFVHWWNWDRQRPGKSLASVLDIGRRVRPAITPQDPDAVELILTEKIQPR